MARQFLTGLTYSLFYHYRDDHLGLNTNVDLPRVNIYTPTKALYVNQGVLSATGVTTGEYQYNFFAPSGLTPGTYFSIATGITANGTIFSEKVSFEIVDITLEPFWVGYDELREFLELEPSETDNEEKLKQALAAAIELVEGYTNRKYGIRQIDEIIEIKDTDRVTLKHFPINSVVAITPTVKTIPRDVTNLVIETLTGSQVSFYYRVDYENGILKLLDSAGFDCNYDGVLLGISYLAGFATVPEPVRQAALHLAGAINALSCTEGIESMRFADLSFSVDKQLFAKHIKDLLAPYRNNVQV